MGVGGVIRRTKRALNRDAERAGDLKVCDVWWSGCVVVKCVKLLIPDFESLRLHEK